MSYDIISTYLGKELSDCSGDTAIVNLIIANDQRQRLAFYHTPPSRYTPISPYPANTKQQLDMRRKVEILKYSNNQQNSKTNNLTKNEKWALLSRGKSSQSTSYSALLSNRSTVCTSNETKLTSSTASDIPGPPINIYYDPTTPLYHYQNASINNASYSNLPADDISELKLYTQDEVTFLYESAPIYEMDDISNVLTTTTSSKNQSLQTRNNFVGSIVTTIYMPKNAYIFSFSIPIGIWIMGSVKEGIIDTTICPDDTTVDWAKDPSYNPHIDPIYGNMNYLNQCYSQFPGVFTPENTMKIHIAEPVSLNITYSGIPVIPLVTPTIYTSFTAPIPGQQNIQFNDVSFSPFDMDAGQFYGIQYVGNLIIDNLQLNIQAEQVFDVAISMNYMYDYLLAAQFDYLKTGIFFNLSQVNQNVSDGVTFSSIVPRFIQSSFLNYVRGSTISTTTPTMTSATIGIIGLNFVTFNNIVGNFDTFVLYRSDIRNDASSPNSTFMRTFDSGSNTLPEYHIFGGLTGNSYTDLNLYPNMTYNYSIQPVFNNMNGSIVQLGTVTTYDISINAQIEQNSVTNNSVSIINIVGKFTQYTIIRNDISFSGLTNNIFTDTGLIPDVSYSYYIQPYFSSQQGSMIFLGTITTLNPNILYAYYRLLTNTSILIDISGVFSSLTIVRNGYPSKIFSITPTFSETSLQIKHYEFTDTNINTSTSVFPNGFVLGQNYSYSIIPSLFNNNGITVNGNTYLLSSITVPIVPLTVVVNTNQIQISNSLVLIPLVNYQDFYYVTVARKINGTFIGSEATLPIKNPINSPVYTDISSSFNANSYYTYDFIPYNNIDIPGTTYTTPKLSPYAKFSITNTYISSIGVSFDFTNTSVLQKNNFHHVTVQKILKNSPNGFVYPIQTIYDGTNSYYDTFTTSENPLSYYQLSFTYIFTAYNVLNMKGDVRNSGDISPYASIIFNQFQIDCSTQITFTIQNNPTYSYLHIKPYYSYDNTTYTPDTNIIIHDYNLNDGSFITINYSILPQIFLPVDSFYFEIYPYNASNIFKQEFLVTTPRISPLPYIKFLNYNDGNTFYNYGLPQEKYSTVRLNLTDTSDYIDAIGIIQPSYYSYQFAEISGGIMGTPDPVKYRFSNLSTYTSNPDLFAYIVYQYAIIPFNAIDVSGMYITTPYYSPKSSINIQAFSYSEPNIYMSFLSSSMFAYAIISRYKNAIFDASYLCMRNTFLFIDPTTQYYGGYAYSYSVQSYNAVNISGDYVTTYPPFSPTANINSDYTVTISTTDISFSFALSNSQQFYSLSALMSTNGQTPTNIPLNKTASDSIYVINQYFYGDCSYVFQLTPYNANAIPNPSATITTMVYSPPATITIGTVHINNTDISFAILRGSTGGAAYYIYVSICTAGIPGPFEPVPIGTTIFKIYTHYTADTSYSVIVIPYNALDVSNSSAILYSNPISPAALVTIGPVSASTSDISFAFTNVFSQLYYYVYVTRTVGNYTFPYAKVPVGTTIYHDPSSVFYADTSYVYSVMPYNVLDISNIYSMVKTLPISPPATVTVGIPSVSYNDISFAFTGLNMRPFYYVYVTRIVRGKYKNSVRIPFKTSIYIDPSNVFTADTSYSYMVVPYNAMDISNNYAAVTTVSVSPTPVVQIGYPSISATSSYFPIIYANTYSYVSVARYINGIMLGSYIVQPIGSILYTDPSNVFYANTNYSYSILPFNAVNNAGSSINTGNISPPIIIPPSVQFTQIDVSHILFSYSDIRNFYYVSITRYMNSKKIDTQKQGPNMSTYVDPSNVFYPDSSYAYALLPYSTTDVSNINMIYYSPAVSPPAYVQVSALSISGDYTSFTFTQNNVHAFYVADITSISGGILGTTQRVQNGTTSYLDTSRTYTADISYGYSVLPYNVLLSAGTAIQTSVNSPKASALFSQYTDICYNKIRFTYAAGKNRYYYVRIRRQKNGIWIDSNDIIQPIKGTSYTDTSSVFTADSSYSYYVIPYNAIDFNNYASAFYTYAVSTWPSAFIGAFSSVSLQNIQFSFTTTTSFYYTFISRIVNGIQQPWIRQPVSSLTYSDPSGNSNPSGSFVAYFTYQYKVLPYNAVDSSGMISQTAVVSPPATVAFLNYNNIMNNQITIQFAQSTAYSYVQVAEISGNITGVVQWTLYGGILGTVIGGNQPSDKFTDTNLWPVILYSYLVTPFNAVNQSNTSMTTPSVSPTAYVTDNSYTVVSANIIQFVYNVKYPSTSNLTYSTLKIAPIVNGKKGSYSSNISGAIHVYQDPSSTFYPNNSYSYSLIPYNAQNIPGNEWITALVSPIPSVSYVSYSDISFTSVRVNFNYTTLGSYSYVILTEWINNNTWGNSMKSAVGDTSFVDIYLSASNTYSFVITPYNAVDISGISVSTGTNQPISPPTYLNPSTISYGASSTVAINILFSNPSSFQYLQIARITCTTNGTVVSVGPYITTSSYISSYTDSSGSFSFNNAYKYSIIPYNALGISGETIVTPLIIVNDATVLFDASNGYTVSLSSISFHLINAILYYYVSVTPIVGGITKTTVTLTAGQTYYTDTNDAPFYSDISYCYVIAPYNNSNINKPANNIITPITTVPATVSFGQYGYASPYYCTTTAISFTYIQGTTHYYYVSISRIVNGISSSGIVQPIRATSYVDPSNNFTADCSYAYSILPFNYLGVANMTGILFTIPVSPIASGPLSITYINVSSTIISWSYQTIGKCYYIGVTRIIRGIINNASTTIQSIGNTIYTDPSNAFVADVSYAYSVVPYNALGIVNIAATSITTTVSPDASSVIFVGYSTISSSAISWNYQTFGRCYSFQIVRYINGILDNSSSFVPPLPNNVLFTDNTITFLASSTYSYQCTPFNAVYRSNVNTITITTNTSPPASVSLGAISVSSSSISFSLNNLTTFYTVSVLRRKNGQLRDISSNLRIATYIDPSNSFTADSSYSYTVTPYNAINVANTSVTTSPVSPAASISIGTVTLSATTSSFTFSNMTSYYYAIVQPLINGINSGLSSTVFTGITTYTNPNNQYYANSAYSYSVVPYNAVNIPGSVYNSMTVSPPSTISIGTITSTSQQISFPLVNTTSFYNITVARIVNGVLIESPKSVPYGTSVYTDPSNTFYASMTYSYAIQSYNAVGTAGSSYITSPVSLTATVTTGPISINANDASFAFLNTYSFYSVSVARIINGQQIESFQPVPLGTTVYIDPSNVFYNNIQYSYAIQPYNALGMAGTVFITPYVYYGIISAISVQNKNIIDSTGLLTYYPFNYIANTTLSVYVAPYSTIIDTIGMVMNYGFDIPLILPAVMSQYTISCSTTAISVSLINSPTLYYLSVARIINGTFIENYQALSPGISVYTDPSNVFYPINVYSYSFIPYNIAGLPSSPYATVGVSPLPSISTGPFSSNSSDISFALLTSTSFYQASIQRLLNGTPIETFQSVPYGTTVYVDPSNSFSTDVSYSYAIVPYNVLGVAGPTYTTSFVSFLPIINAGPVSYNNSDISFALFGNFNTVTVARIVNGQPIETYKSVPYGTTIYIDPSNIFYPINTYSYSILPYNKSGVVGLSYTTIPISPLPSISIGSIGNICVNGNDISFALLTSTSYTTVGIARLVNGQPIESYQSIPYGTTIYIDPSNVFYSTNNYSYSIIPYNVLGVAGTTFVTTPVSPYPSVNVGTISYNNTDISFALFGNFNTVAIARIVNGTPIETYQSVPYGITTYIDPSNAFYPMNSYSYSILPYNVLGTAGTMYTTIPICPLPDVNIGSIGNICVNSNDISFALLNTTSYNTISIARLVNGQLIEPYQSIPYGTTIYIDPSNMFYPINTYSYSILPYNKFGMVGISYTTTPVSVYPSISIGSIRNICVSGNDISFALLSTTTYNTISIARLVNGQPIESYQSIPYGTTIYIDPSNVFYSVNSYSYSILPYNAVGQAGTTFVTTPVSPYPSVNVGIPIETFQNISMALNGYPSFYQVSVQRLHNRIPIESFQLLSPTITTIYTDPSIVFNYDISYSYSVIPYNAVGQAGNMVTSVAVLYILPTFISTISVQNMNIIDSIGLSVYYSFEPLTNAVAPSYVPTFLTMIDNSGMLMNYGFDL